MSNKLQARVAKRLILFTLAIISLMGSYLSWQFEQASNQLHQVSESSLSTALVAQLRQKGMDMTLYMRDALTNALYSYDIEQISQMIADIVKQHDIVHAYVFDDENKVLHDGSELLSAYGSQIPTNISTLLAKKPTEVASIEAKTRLIFAGNVFIGTEKIGGIVIEFSLQNIHRDIEQLKQVMVSIEQNRSESTVYDIATIALILIIMASFVVWKMTQRFIAPITKLSDYARNIGRGHYDFTVEVSSKNDELAELGRAFDNMRQNLQSSSLQIYNLAYHDTLTNLPNRRQFKAKLELLVEQEQCPCSLLFIDVDNFKWVNDNLGHEIGDKVLIEVANRLCRALQDSEQYIENNIGVTEQSMVCRLGGDEFTIILSNEIDLNTLADVAQRIITDLGQPYFIDGQKAQVGASIGIALYPKDGVVVPELMRNADTAMYQAKFNGKNQYQFYSDELKHAMMNEVKIEQELAHALSQQALTLEYQPKYDLSANKFNAVEALIRWQHPTEGNISPAIFIPMAERSGLIFAIGEWVVKAACQQLSAWQGTAASELSIAINISAVQLQQDNLAEIIFAHLDSYQLPYHLLEIEVTETAVIEIEEDAIKILSQLSERGIRVWMDDFGTGFSSLSYLRKLPFYGIKIDRSFIRDIAISSNDRKFCEVMITMAHRLGLKVVAEGVEQQAQEVLIEDLHCDHAQGFLYGKPNSEQEIIKMIFPATITP